jgi:hypothetical protein
LRGERKREKGKVGYCIYSWGFDSKQTIQIMEKNNNSIRIADRGRHLPEH